MTHFQKNVFFRPMSAKSAPQLGALAIEESLKRANVEKEAVDEVYMGNVLPGGMGQAPDRQAAIFAGLPSSVPCTMVNKVCASGMKVIKKKKRIFSPFKLSAKSREPVSDSCDFSGKFK